MTQILADAPSAADLLSLTVETYLVYSRYINRIKDASGTASDVQKQLKSLKLILSKLSRTPHFLDHEREESPKVPDPVKAATEDSEEYCETLKILQSKLQEQLSTTEDSGREDVPILPIAETELQSILEVLGNYVRVFGKGISVDFL